MSTTMTETADTARTTETDQTAGAAPASAAHATAAGLDPTAAFADRMMGAALGWFDLMAVHLGSQLGWYAALSQADGLTAGELAARTSTDARYAREWLEQQAASGILRADDATDAEARRFRLADGVAEVLLDRDSLSYLEPLARMAAASSAQLDALLEAYRVGGGVSWEQLGAHAREAQADMNRPWFAQLPALFAGVERLDEVLRRPGARIADLGAGGGWSSIALAQAYPGLRVVGFDVDEASVEMARRNASSSCSRTPHSSPRRAPSTASSRSSACTTCRTPSRCSPRPAPRSATAAWW